MQHETQPAAGAIPEEIQHLDFGRCAFPHTQPKDSEYSLQCRRCGATAEICESHYNHIRSHALTHDVMCMRCRHDGPLTKVFEPKRLSRRAS